MLEMCAAAMKIRRRNKTLKRRRWSIYDFAINEKKIVNFLVNKYIVDGTVVDETVVDGTVVDGWSMFRGVVYEGLVYKRENIDTKKMKPSGMETSFL